MYGAGLEVGASPCAAQMAVELADGTVRRIARLFALADCELVSSKNLSAQLIGLLGLCSIAGCGTNVAPGDWDYPVNNPAPKQFLSVHGTMDPSLDIDFRTDWRSENPHCQYICAWSEAGPFTYTARTALPITQQGDKFSARVSVDGVLPGRCQWRFAGVTFDGRTGFRTELIATNSYPLRPGQSPNGVAVLHCKWTTYIADGQRGISCTWPKDEDRNASVLGGVLWWHPEATELEVHFIAD
jgi:hypothetical protein